MTYNKNKQYKQYIEKTILINIFGGLTMMELVRKILVTNRDFLSTQPYGCALYLLMSLHLLITSLALSTGTSAGILARVVSSLKVPSGFICG